MCRRIIYNFFKKPSEADHILIVGVPAEILLSPFARSCQKQWFKKARLKRLHEVPFSRPIIYKSQRNRPVCF